MSGSWSWQRFEFEVQKLIELDAERRLTQAEWDEVARAAAGFARQSAEIADSLPDEFWHFLEDFDIRRRDRGYGLAQLERLRNAMSEALS